MGERAGERSFRLGNGGIPMRSAFKVIWPLSIILLLALMALQRGGTSMDNPLGDHAVERWFSISRR